MLEAVLADELEELWRLGTWQTAIGPSMLKGSSVN